MLKPPYVHIILADCKTQKSLISWQFKRAFYQYYGRKHKYHLISFIKALVLAKLLGLNDSQLISVLKCSAELRDFCEFNKVPDASYFTRFKQNYCSFIAEMFDNLVDITEPICSEINEKKADYLIYDTTGIELNVAENNPKFFSTKLKQAKSANKGTDFNPYISVYGLLPDCSETNPAAKQQYINGHYCYALKTGILTNGLGIIRDISVFDDDFKIAHPETVTPKTDNPDIDKEIGDSVSLKPVLSDFFYKHDTIHSIKDTFSVAHIKTYNVKTIKAELYIAGITQLVGVLLAKAIHKPELFKSVKRLIA